MKKVLSFILALALVIGLVPTVAFAAGATKTFDFGDVDQWHEGGAQTYGVVDIDAPDGIEYNADESLNKADSQTSMFRITETREKYTKIRGRNSTWLNPNTKDNKDGQVVFSAELGENPSAGWYQIKFTGVDWCEASSLYIYADGKYVGIHIPDRSVSTAKIGKEENFGAVYLEPNEQGKVDFLLAVAERGTIAAGTLTYANFYLKTLSLTYLDNQEKYGYRTVAPEMPEEIDLTSDAEGVSFVAYADAGDGIPRAMNGITSNKTRIENPFKVEVIDGDSVEITSSTVTDGTATIKLKPVKAGVSKIKFTAMKNDTEELYTDTKTITVRGEEEETDESVAAPEDVSYIVRGSESKFNAGIDMGEDYTAGEVGSHKLNTSFTAKALEKITIGDKKYNFAYWQTAGGAPIEDADASYTFTPKSNFTLEAVYVPAEPTDTDKKVQFWNYNRVYLGEETVTNGKVSEMPADPTLAGHTFAGWAAENIGAFTADTQLTAALTRVVAQFTKNAPAFSVGGETKAYDDEFTKTAEDLVGENAFSYWTINDQVASYDKTLSFNVWNTVEVEAVYEGAKTAIPTVVLDKVNADEYFILYEVPEGYTAIDAGIVFSENGTPSVESADSKASATKLTGQFTAAPGKDTHTTARGYVMYMDANGDIRVLYSK